MWTKTTCFAIIYRNLTVADTSKKYLRLRFCFFSLVPLWLTLLDKVFTFKEKRWEREKGKTLTCFISLIHEIINRKYKQIILSNGLAYTRLELLLGSSRHPHTSHDPVIWQFSTKYLFDKIVYWYCIKIILQCIWRILITKKEGKCNMQPIALSCTVTLNILCGTENSSVKSMIGRRASAPFRMHSACSNQSLWLRVSTQDWYGAVSVGASASYNGEDLEGQMELSNSILYCKLWPMERNLYILQFLFFFASFAKCFWSLKVW